MSVLHIDAVSQTTSPQRTFVLASRPSKLALIQTHAVLAPLRSAFPALTFDTLAISSTADRNQVQALHAMGGAGIFTSDLEAALMRGDADILVHSLKDMPTVRSESREIAAIMQRENPVDCLVVKAGLGYKTLGELPDGSVIGTGSVRRVAQLKRHFPELEFLLVRGNIDTRLAKLDATDGLYTALILAKAGLVRLGWGNRITSELTAPTLYHAVGQGALGIEIRSDDVETREMCRVLNHLETEWTCSAERECLRWLEGGCSVPVGVKSSLEMETGKQKGLLSLTGCVTALDGQAHVERMVTGTVQSKDEAEDLGARLAKVLIENGAAAILEAIQKDRESAH